MSLYVSSELDGRATGRRWPAEFDRSRPELLLPLVPDDGMAFCYAAQYGKTYRRTKIHIASDGEFVTLCGRPFVYDNNLSVPLPLPLCNQCGLQLYTRRRWREENERWTAAYDALDLADVEELKKQISDLQAQNRYLLRTLAEHGLLIEG